MTRNKLLILPALVCFTLAAASSAQERTRPGMWENTVTAGGQTSARSHCVTASDAAGANGPVSAIRASAEKAAAKGGACTLQGFKMEGNTKTESLRCGMTSYSNSTVFHDGNSFETTTTMTRAGVAKVTLIKGRRTGDCPP